VVVGVAVVLVVGAGVVGNSAARSAIGSWRVHATVRSNPTTMHTRFTAVDARWFILVTDRVAGMLAVFLRSTRRRNGGSLLTEKSRSQIFQGLAPIVGEEAVGEMLAHYPATEGEQPITRDYLDARLAELRIELHQQTKQLMVWIPTSTAAICAVVAFVARIGA
jgi:hypothetical protein